MSGLKYATALIASMAVANVAHAEEPTSCTIDDGVMTINITEGGFADQQLIIDLNSPGDREVRIGDAVFTLERTNTDGSIIETAGDINETAFQLNNERGKDGLAYKFFASQQAPAWQMLEVGIADPADLSTVELKTYSRSEGNTAEEIQCSGDSKPGLVI